MRCAARPRRNGAPAAWCALTPPQLHHGPRDAWWLCAYADGVTRRHPWPLGRRAEATVRSAGAACDAECDLHGRAHEWPGRRNGASGARHCRSGGTRVRCRRRWRLGSCAESWVRLLLPCVQSRDAWGLLQPLRGTRSSARFISPRPACSTCSMMQFSCIKSVQGEILPITPELTRVQGSVVYHAPTAGLESFLDSLGRPCPPRTNPAVRRRVLAGRGPVPPRTMPWGRRSSFWSSS